MVRAFNRLHIIYVGFFLISLLIHPLWHKEKQLYAEETCDFTLMTIEGEKIQLKDYRGKKIYN